MSPCQPCFTRSAMARAAIAMALTPCSGAPPAWLASPLISICKRYPPVAPRVSFSAGAAVEIEDQLGPAQQVELHQPRTVQPDFLLDEPAERERRVRQAAPQDRQGRGQHHGHPGPIVGPQPSERVGRGDEISLLHRLRTDADRHRVHMGHQHAARTGMRAGKLKNQDCRLRRPGAFCDARCRCGSPWNRRRRPVVCR